ncbi:MAG: c-type cytochrome, partial [bacterium]
LYLSLGCAQCHTRDGKRLLAPTFKGVYGKEEQLSDGSTVVVTDEYIKESILHPEAKIVAGFQPMHPPQSWELDDEKINALIAFIISLK